MSKFIFECAGKMVKAESHEEAFHALGFRLEFSPLGGVVSDDSTHSIKVTGPVPVKHSYLYGGKGAMTIAEIQRDIVSIKCTIYKNKAYW